ncbi:hypothetical protein QBC38DRAFT_451633 [Podospora fimiseda]|uniref:Uncharacterized protein n=1 Tax=Podospora fimiseda TaxID=252190 RepID=A0AAN7H4L5_9PEZI|nr:hypothetical protein QBC38DRAFT_451633 [Podospora fimiseda]
MSRPVNWDTYYCCNYYSQTQCTNTVSSFGDRCKLCRLVKDGKPLTPGLLPLNIPYIQPEEPEPAPTPGFLTRALQWTVGGGGNNKK